jgi:RHS repeat-associated protein
MSDQINSTRIITDDAGSVVYSEAYGPYGDVQKTWTKTYDPKQKFSGKEREGYSELDYFGARYFDNNSYRFISVDPIINKEEALSNPQLWNLYAYCRNNPITYFDPDGAKYEVQGYNLFKNQWMIIQGGSILLILFLMEKPLFQVLTMGLFIFGMWS